MPFKMIFWLWSLALVALANGFCYNTNGRLDKTVTGRLIPVCEYNGLEILEGSNFKTADCMECKCQQATLTCCGFGVNAGVFMPPVGCKMVADGCYPIFVRESDPNLDCKTGLNLKFTNIKPADIKPSFPGVFPNFPGLKFQDPRDMLNNGGNFKYTYTRSYNPMADDTTTNSLRNFLAQHGWML